MKSKQLRTPEEKATNLSKNLKRYFATTPREQVLKDWEQTAKYDEIGTILFSLAKGKRGTA